MNFYRSFAIGQRDSGLAIENPGFERRPLCSVNREFRKCQKGSVKEKEIYEKWQNP